MQPSHGLQTVILAAAFGIGTIVAGAPRAEAGYVQTDLVSDISGLAELTDPLLKNPWGISESTTSPFWISDQATGKSTLNTVHGTTVVSESATVVTTASPTGQVANTTACTPTPCFEVNGTTSKSSFIFANLDGTITAWNSSLAPGNVAVTEVTSSGESYMGLAIDTTTKQIYAANTKNGGSIDVFSSSFAPVNLGPSAFVDPNLPVGLVPFNIQEINGLLYVTYAPSSHAGQTGATAGTGVVAVFNSNGTFVTELISGNALAAPWGLALAPANFGPFSGDLLVGNFSFVDSDINAFNPATGAFEGSIPIDPGPGQTIGGLWGLSFGNGASGGSPDVLYFADGINGEKDGLFGAISFAPEPSSLLLLAPALAFVAGRRRPLSRLWRR